MSKAMLFVADQIREKALNMEKYPGTGFHDNDRNPTRPDIFVAQQKQLVENSDKFFCKRSEDLVFFQGEYDVALVGDDCTKALDVLQQWASKINSLPPEAVSPKAHKMRKCMAKLKITEVDGIARLIFRRPLWMDYVSIFYEMGQGVTGQPFTEEE